MLLLYPGYSFVTIFVVSRYQKVNNHLWDRNEVDEILNSECKKNDKNAYRILV